MKIAKADITEAKLKWQNTLSKKHTLFHYIHAPTICSKLVSIPLGHAVPRDFFASL